MTSTLTVFGGALALLVVFMVVNPSQSAAVAYTEGDFSDSSSDNTICGIISNWRNKGNNPAKFYAHTEPCTGPRAASKTICEMKLPTSGYCPNGTTPGDYGFNDFEYNGSCYKMKPGWRRQDYAAGLCRHINSMGRLLHISTEEEFQAVGLWIAKSGQTRCGSTTEFALGLAEPPMPTK